MKEQDWLDWRKAGVTATDVANAVTGMYGGAYETVARKIGVLEQPEMNERMERGLRWEKTIADMVHLATGWFVVGEQQQVTQSEFVEGGDPRWRATLDGFLSLKRDALIDDLLAVLEIKTVGLGVRPNRERWWAQVEWQMFCAGLEEAVVVEVVIDDTEDTFVSMRLHRIESDPFLRMDLLEHAEDMWAHMQAGTLPDPVASSLDAVKAVHRTAVGSVAALDLSDIGHDVRRYRTLKDEQSDLKKELDAVEATIRDAMGMNTKGEVDGYRVTVSEAAWVVTDEAEQQLLADHPQYGRKVLDRDLIKEADPKLYESYRTRDGARRLTVTAPKGE